MNRDFSKEVQTANKYMKKCSIQGSANQKCIEILFHPSQNGYYQKPKNNPCWEGPREIGTLIHY
jgi:hypothetical protein